ncbi:MAG: cytochrome P450 [Gammaproteobacteria bacterium]
MTTTRAQKEIKGIAEVKSTSQITSKLKTTPGTLSYRYSSYIPLLTAGFGIAGAAAGGVGVGVIAAAVSFLASMRAARSGHYNPHLPSLTAKEFSKNICVHDGMAKIFQEMYEKADKNGVVEFHLFDSMRIMFIKNPSHIAKIFKKKSNLGGDDSNGIQPFAFHKSTLVSLEKPSLAYSQVRKGFDDLAYHPIDQIFSGIKLIYDYYKKTELDSKVIPNVRNFVERFAMTVMLHNLLGLDITAMSEDDKTKIANFVHHLLGEVSNPLNNALIVAHNHSKVRGMLGYVPQAAKNAFQRYTGGDVDLKVIKSQIEGIEKIIISAIKKDKNEDEIFSRLQDFTKNIDAINDYEIHNKNDLYSPAIMGLIKLILIGGFETTSKLLLCMLIFLGDPKNQKFKEKLLEEMKGLGKPISECDYEDLKNTKYAQAFIFEILRLFPPFPFLKTENKEGFWLDDKTYVPAGTQIIADAFHAHRDESIYKNANAFNPERWLDKLKPESTDKFSIEMAPFKDYFFTFGRWRDCPGRKIPVFEGMLLMLGMLEDFENIVISGIDYNKPFEEHIELGTALELREGVMVGATLVPKQKLASVPAEEKQQEAGFRMSLAI